jgi:photosystem II stability/assembly factor-like uncharacterized protein
LRAAILLIALAAQAQDGPSLRGLSALDSKVAWASGSRGTVLRTIDGGETWEMKTIEPGLDFRDVEAWSTTGAVIMSSGPGKASRIYTTRDGGTNWTLRLENTDLAGFFDAIAFWDQKRGLLLGDPVDGRFTVMRTSDAGESWERLTGPEAREGEAAFAASGTCLAVGPDGAAWIGTGGVGGGRVLRSADWGSTWQASETPMAHSSASEGIFSLAFRDSKNGVAVGGDYQKPGSGSAAVTSDGGKTWLPARGLNGYRSAIVMTGEGTYAAGPNGVDRSMDGGRTWSLWLPQGFHAIAVAENAIWAAGSAGRVRKLSD